MFPIVPTVEGRYIIRNLVLISAGIMIGATVRGGLTPEPPDKALRLHHPSGSTW